MTPASIFQPKESIGSILGAMSPASITLPKESIGSILGTMSPASIFQPKESIGSIFSATTPASIPLPRESIGNLFGSKSAYTYPKLNTSLRRFEILLPLQFNNGRDVPAKMLAEARSELIDRFGAVSCESAEIEGYWRNDNAIVRDRLRRVWVDVPDLHSNLEWMRLYAERWRERLGQDELYSRNYELKVIRVCPYSPLLRRFQASLSQPFPFRRYIF